MHYCKDEYPIMLNAINNTVREAIYKTTPNIFFDRRPSSWVVNNVLNAVKYLYREIVTKSPFTLLVIINRLVELYFRFVVKREDHFLNRPWIFANTTFPGTGFTLPVRNSDSLRLAIFTHSASISADGGLSVRSSESTTMTLSSMGRDSASCIISFIPCMIIFPLSFFALIFLLSIRKA